VGSSAKRGKCGCDDGENIEWERFGSREFFLFVEISFLCRDLV